MEKQHGTGTGRDFHFVAWIVPLHLVCDKCSGHCSSLSIVPEDIANGVPRSRSFDFQDSSFLSSSKTLAICKGKIFESSSGSFRYLGGVVAVGQCQRSDLQTVGAIAFGEALAGESVRYGKVHGIGKTDSQQRRVDDTGR